MSLSNYGEQFAKNVLLKFDTKAITPAIANTDYEGEIKKGGDRVNVLMFLDDIPMGDYTVGSDMTVTHMEDTEASLVINRKKYYNFDIDAVDSQFTYVEDLDSALIKNAANALAKVVDHGLLYEQVEEVGAGNRVSSPGRGGHWTFVVGDTGTCVTITTSATVGTATLTGAIGENTADECTYFPVNIVGRGFRVCSDLVNSPWYRITSRTSSTVLTFNNWDGSVTGGGQTVEGIMGQVNHRNAGDTDPQFDGAGPGYGCEIEGMLATQVTASNVYELLCDVVEKFDESDIPDEDRHIVVPAWFKGMLKKASELQPDIAMYHEDVVINGRIAKVAGLEVHMASNDRFSTMVEPIGSWVSAQTGTKVLANHTSFVTFAHAWTKSRVVQAEKQFATLYQGLNLFGFKVLNARRKAGAYLYCYK